ECDGLRQNGRDPHTLSQYETCQPIRQVTHLRATRSPTTPNRAKDRNNRAPTTPRFRLVFSNPSRKAPMNIGQNDRTELVELMSCYANMPDTKD
ncbi:MAG: hypothetical protein M3Y35_14615, partial [Actinomycetota bacterium]|nr:hypothetical protein [Actinomycetota bacterium]